MARSARAIVLTAVGFSGLLLLVATALLMHFHSTIDKSRLEVMASEALGLDVSMGGAVNTGFFPRLLVGLEDVHVRNRSMEVAFAKEAALQIDLFSLLGRQVRIEKIALKDPRFTIERDRDGGFNFEEPGAATGLLPVLNWPVVSLSGANLVYTDKRSGEGFVAENCRIDLQRFQLSGGERANLMKNLSLAAELGCAQVRSQGATVSEVALSANAARGVVDLKPVTTRVFGAQGAGSIAADFSNAIPST